MLYVNFTLPGFLASWASGVSKVFWDHYQTRNLAILAIVWLLIACKASQPVSPVSAQTEVISGWQANQHTVWAIDWPAAPVGGPLVVAVWRSGERYRLEILEARPPALVGETLIVNGNRAWRYNRFNPPSSFAPTSPVLSPVTDLFDLIDNLLLTPAVAAGQEQVRVNYSLAQKIRLTFAEGQSLILWRDEASGLPVRMLLLGPDQRISLKVRQSEPLPEPPPGLFEVGAWIYQ